jgi:hypothetical protein
MFRNSVIFTIGAFAIAGCHTLLGDRILQVSATTVSDSGTPLRDCQLSLISGDTGKVFETKDNISPEYLNSFLNPPIQGTYYFKITCAGRANEFHSSKFNFTSGPYFHKFGRIVIGP